MFWSVSTTPDTPLGRVSPPGPGREKVERGEGPSWEEEFTITTVKETNLLKCNDIVNFSIKFYKSVKHLNLRALFIIFKNIIFIFIFYFSNSFTDNFCE